MIIMEIDYGDLSLGTISDIKENYITIHPETWAPGIWVGLESYNITFSKCTDIVKIKVIDLNKRMIFLDKIPNDLSISEDIYLTTDTLEK